jgi:Cd2+/Zn2+-exporting ATPase
VSQLAEQSISVPQATERMEKEATKCLARSVADAMASEPSLEAVTIDRGRHTISVATLGKSDQVGVTARITSAVRKVQEHQSGFQCGLFTGAGDCDTCATPLTQQERQSMTIRSQGDATTIARVTCPTAPRFWRWRDIPWPKVVQRDVEFLEHAEEADEWKPQLLAAALCGLFGVAAVLLKGHAYVWLVYVAAYVAGGWFTVGEVLERLKKGAIDVHFLMLAVAVGSASIGAWGEGATLLFLFSLSGALEHFALGRTQREIRSLFKDTPKVATVLDEQGREQEFPVDQLRNGLRLLIKPGAQFPVDGEIVKGQTAADESNLTGEATPVEKGPGETVLAGTINLWGAVEVVVLRPASESALQKIIHLIREAQHRKAPAQLFTDKFSAAYTYIVLGLSFAMFFFWWLGFGLAPFASASETKSAFYRTMTLLVVASPCALVLSIPSAVLAAIAWGARHGILFRGGAAVEKLADVSVVALDKTGTLTTGELRVEKVESFPPGREREVAQLAYSLERLSTHPLARAITRYGKQKGIQPLEMESFESVTGSGLRARRNGEECLLGRREWFAGGPAARVISTVPATESGFSEVWMREGLLLGRIILRDDIRPQAKAVVEELRSEGLRCVVLTGDRRSSGEQLKKELQLDDVRAELKPEQKVSIVQSFSNDGRRVAMVGDGVNDAPSLAAAHVGVAMGARGSDAALEQAEVVLMHDRLENFLAAFRLSQRARRVIRQNLIISLGTVLVLVCCALVGGIPLTLGVVGHEGSTVIVVMNSLRLLLGGAATASPRPA